MAVPGLLAAGGKGAQGPAQAKAAKEGWAQPVGSGRMNAAADGGSRPGAGPEAAVYQSPHHLSKLWLKPKRLWAVTRLAMLCWFGQVLGPATTQEETRLVFGAGGRELVCRAPRARGQVCGEAPSAAPPMPSGVGFHLGN